MASLRAPLVTNAVSLLRDPTTQQSPLDKKIEFLRAKGLTNDELDEAFRQVGMANGSAAGTTPASSGPTGLSNDGGEFFPIPVAAQQPTSVPHLTPQPVYALYPLPSHPQPMSESQRDWRDWFIMAVVSGTAMMGVYSLARKYLFPHLVPPPLPAFQQSQQDLQAQFDTIQKQLDEMAAQTENQTKTIEAQRDEVARAVTEVERALTDMEAEGEKAKDELKEIRQEIAHVRELVPKLIESSQAAATSTLTDVQQELKSLKALLITRPQSFASSSPGPYPHTGGGSLPYGIGASTAQSTGNLLSGRPSIPAWQLASRPGSTTPSQTTTSTKVEVDTGKEKDKVQGVGEDLSASGVLVNGVEEAKPGDADQPETMSS